MDFENVSVLRAYFQERKRLLGDLYRRYVVIKVSTPIKDRSNTVLDMLLRFLRVLVGLQDAMDTSKTERYYARVRKTEYLK